MAITTKKLSELPWLRGMNHNGRVVALTEPFWSIPFNMLTVYAVLYMLELGFTKREVGLTQTVLVGTQILSSLFSGSLTDRIGRKRATLIFDMISWGGASIVWALSGHIAGFIFAAFLNGINKVVYVSFSCMITEGATSSQRLRNYSGLHFMVLTGGFFAPIGGLIVSRMGIIQGTRTLYYCAALIMGLMFIIRHLLWIEPQVNKLDKKKGLFKGIGESLQYFFADRQRIIVFFLQSIAQFYMIFKPLFYYVYLKETVGLKSSVISAVPVVMSIITMIVLLGVIPKIENKQRKSFLTTGLFLGSLSLLFLVFSSGGNLLFLAGSIICDGFSTALTRPLLDSLWADHLQDENRTRQLAAGHLIFGLLSIPAGSISAELYKSSSFLPFAAAMILLLISAFISFFLKRLD